jgi:uncharacterized protein (DUF433 family)
MDTTVMAFSREQAAKLSKLSAHQLRAWAKGLYCPSWTELGLYTFVDLVALRTLGQLRTKYNVRPAELRRASKYLKAHSDQPWSKLKLGVGPKNRIYFWDSDARCWLSADGVDQSIASVALDQIGTKLKREVSAVRRRPDEDFGQTERTRGVCGGQLRFKGTRVTVAAVQALLRIGRTSKQILTEFPSIAAPDIAAARRKLSAA